MGGGGRRTLQIGDHTIYSYLAARQCVGVMGGIPGLAPIQHVATTGLEQTSQGVALTSTLWGSREPEVVRTEGVPDHPHHACCSECLADAWGSPQEPPTCAIL